MRYIVKSEEPQEFIDWKAAENNDWKPTYDALPKKEKEAIYESLLAEQGYICCYCERELHLIKLKDYHIEHLEPQSVNTDNALDYKNMLCSCLGKEQTERVPLHCGHLKGADIIPVHPLQSGCQSQFKYTGYGVIEGSSEDAETTISTLGLNIKKLQDMRKKVLSTFDGLNKDDFQEYCDKYIQKRQGKYRPFISMIEFLFCSKENLSNG